MASRESQGLQVALILFVMVTVVLAVTTYVYFRKSEEKIALAAAAQVQVKDANDRFDKTDFENQLLKHVLGFKRQTVDNLETIRGQLQDDQEVAGIWNDYEQDMATYGTGLPADDLCYRNLPQRLVTTIRTKNADLVVANTLVEELSDERNSIRKTQEGRTAAAMAERDKAVENYDVERRTFVGEKSTIEASKNQIASKLTDQGKELTRLSGKMAEEIETRDKVIGQMQQQLDAMRAKQLAERETTFETPDGKITWVNQGASSVWIDLGSADGVQRQMTFSVYDQEEIGVTSGKVKGRIEVTRIMETHLAEARIVEDSLTDPILPDDKIYSPSFKKGQKTRFVLAGMLDINGDGKSDQAKVKSIITMNGGVVDAELLEDGTIAGKMSLETKYLVKGERPTDKSNSKLLEGYSRIVDEATRLGIEPLSLNLLLDRMGYHEDRRTVPLTSGGSGGARKPNTFRPRTAPKSAY